VSEHLRGFDIHIVLKRQLKHRSLANTDVRLTSPLMSRIVRSAIAM